MTNEQKNAIFNYIVKEVGSSGILSSREILFYYIDNGDKIDSVSLLEQQKVSKILELSKTIETAQTQLNVLATPEEINAALDSVK